MDEAKRTHALAQNDRRREAAWADFEDRRAQSAVDMESYAEGRYPITPRQRNFVQNLIQHWNANRAYTEAGYNGNPTMGVGRLFKVPSIAAAIGYEQKLAAKKAGLTSEWVMKQMMKVLPKYMGEEEVEIPVAFQGELIEQRAKKFHSSETNSLLATMAKATDFFDGGSSPDKQVVVHIDMPSLGILPEVEKAIRNPPIALLEHGET